MTEKTAIPTQTLPAQLATIVDTLSEALPYARQFAGKTFVVKYGGHAMGEEHMADNFARDVVMLKQVGINPIVVHGGGPQIGAMLAKLQIKSEFIDGLRVTDRATVDVVEMVLAGTINKQLVTAINSAGGLALGLSGKDGRLIRARKLTRTARDPGSNIEKVLDLGFVGEPTRIDTTILRHIDLSAVIPVIAPIGVGQEGETYNINADTSAGAIAAELKAAKLLMLTDVPGVLDKNKKLISKLTGADIARLREDGTISGGMIPKVETCLDAVGNGVGAAHIIDGRVPHALLLEIFTRHGIGSMIRKAHATA